MVYVHLCLTYYVGRLPSPRSIFCYFATLGRLWMTLSDMQIREVFAGSRQSDASKTHPSHWDNREKVYVGLAKPIPAGPSHHPLERLSTASCIATNIS